jgi:hypothetical protein
MAMMVFPGVSRPISLAVSLLALATLPAVAAGEPTRAAIPGDVRALHVPFVANGGQADERVAFYARTFGGTVFVTTTGEIVYALPAAETREDGHRLGIALTEVLVGSTVRAPRGQGESETRVSSFTGRDRSRWRAGLPVYEAVSLGEVYDGIDLRLVARGDNVEKIFRLRPGARVAAIALRLDGAERLTVDGQGQLVAMTALGPVRFTRPVAFQEIGHRRVEVTVRYALRADGTYGFDVAGHDAAYPLVIDPLLASTFVGGRGLDRAYAMDIGRTRGITLQDRVFIAGVTWSSDFPVTIPRGPYVDYHDDVFVAKLNPSLTRVIAAVYLGGSGSEEAWGVKVAPSGEVWIAGWTSSTDFPTTPGVENETYRGGLTDAFVLKLGDNLDELVASTYLGGGEEDRAQALALIDEGPVVTGFTDSAADFPRERRFGHWRGSDVFVTRISADLRFATSVLLGGNGTDRAYAIDFGGADPARVTGGGMIVITGCAQRHWNNSGSDAWYPTTSGSFAPVPGSGAIAGDGHDAFVTVLDQYMEVLLGSVLMGGAGSDACGRAVKIDRDSTIFVAGMTRGRFGSAHAEFPTTAGAYDDTHNDRRVPEWAKCADAVSTRPGATGRGDAFVAKITGGFGDGGYHGYDATRTLAASTLLGGCASETAMSLALTADGNVVVGGYTYSPDFPTVAGTHDETHGGPADGFVSMLDGDLESLPASTYLGGGRFDAVTAVGVGLFGAVYVTGYTYSPGFPTTLGAYDREYNGGGDAFVSKFDLSPAVIGGD